MSIKVQGVDKIYGKQKALNNVSFEISSGEIVGFLGPNGAGKSTMMKIICCYLPQTKGLVEVEGFDVISQAHEIKKLVGYLPEHNPLYLDMYVKEYLEFVGRLHGIKNKKARIQEMIDLTGLGDEQSKKIGQLSKGYRQRVGLAQAIIHDPKILILDEPTTGLDPNQLVDIRKLIKDLGKDKTVMLSTHTMREVEAICDRAIIINKGSIVLDDSMTNIAKSKTTNSIHVTFENDINLDELRTILSDVKISVLSSKNEIKIEGEKIDEIRKTVMKWSIDSNNNIINLSESGDKLEDIFQSLTKQQ